MTQTIFHCDECEKEHRDSVPIVLHGHFQTRKGGILLPRYDFHFCSIDCLQKWLTNSVIR